MLELFFISMLYMDWVKESQDFFEKQQEIQDTQIRERRQRDKIYEIEDRLDKLEDEE